MERIDRDKSVAEDPKLSGIIDIQNRILKRLSDTSERLQKELPQHTPTDTNSGHAINFHLKYPKSGAIRGSASGKDDENEFTWDEHVKLMSSIRENMDSTFRRVKALSDKLRVKWPDEYRKARMTVPLPKSLHDD